MDTLERAFLLAGVIIAAALVVATALAYRDYRDSRPRYGVEAVSTPGASAGYRSQSTSTAARQPPTTTPAQPASQPSSGTAANTSPAKRPHGTTLVLRASRGDSWIEVHAGSQNGQTLYASTLTQGHAFRVTRKSLWLRVGAPLELDATLNGRSVRLPDVTATMQATGNRLTTLAVG
jgi:hypothetical protein